VGEGGVRGDLEIDALELLGGQGRVRAGIDRHGCGALCSQRRAAQDIVGDLGEDRRIVGRLRRMIRGVDGRRQADQRDDRRRQRGRDASLERALRAWTPGPHRGRGASNNVCVHVGLLNGPRSGVFGSLLLGMRPTAWSMRGVSASGREPGVQETVKGGVKRGPRREIGGLTGGIGGPRLAEAESEERDLRAAGPPAFGALRPEGSHAEKRTRQAV
jgi:hypothetical protein